MPRGNGTGPGGMGPMTGRSAGFCAGFDAPGYASGRLGAGFRRGFGRNREFGKNSGWYRDFFNRSVPEIYPENKLKNNPDFFEKRDLSNGKKT